MPPDLLKLMLSVIVFQAELERAEDFKQLQRNDDAKIFSEFGSTRRTLL